MRAILIALVAVMVIFRLAILSSSLPELADADDLCVGTIAKEHLSKPMLSLFEYQNPTYSHGLIPMGLMAVPFFGIFGDSYASLKLLPLALSALMLVVWYLLCKRYFGSSVAMVVGLLMSFPPPGYTALSLISSGSHYASNLFTGLILLLLIGVAEMKDDHRARAYLWKALLGMVAGFGVWFYYPLVLFILPFLLLWFLLDRRFFARRGFWVSVTCFFVGFSPWFYEQVVHSQEVFRIESRAFTTYFFTEGLFGAIGKGLKLVAEDLPSSVGFRWRFGSEASALDFVYYALALVPLGFLISSLFRKWREKSVRHSAGLALCASCGLVLTIIAVSSFELGPPWRGYRAYRYLAPLFAPGVLLLAMGVEEVRWRWLRVVLPSILIIMGVFGNSSLITPSTLALGWMYRGYSYEQLGATLVVRSGNLSSALKRIRRVPLERAKELIVGAGAGYFAKGRVSLVNETSFRRLKLVAEKVPPRLRDAFLKGVGAGALKQLGYDTARFSRLTDCFDRGKRHLYHGGGVAVASKLWPLILHAFYIRGDIQPLYLRLQLAINSTAENYRPDFVDGIATGLAGDLFYDMSKVAYVLRGFPPEWRRRAWKAVAVFTIRNFGRRNVYRYLIPFVPPQWRKSFYEAFSTLD